MEAANPEVYLPSTYLVECYWPGVTKEAIYRALDRACAAAAEISSTGRHVRLIRSTFVPADEAILSLFEAIGPDAVRDATEQAGLTGGRVSVAEEVSPSSAASVENLPSDLFARREAPG